MGHGLVRRGWSAQAWGIRSPGAFCFFSFLSFLAFHVLRKLDKCGKEDASMVTGLVRHAKLHWLLVVGHTAPYLLE